MSRVYRNCDRNWSQVSPSHSHKHCCPSHLGISDLTRVFSSAQCGVWWVELSRDGEIKQSSRILLRAYWDAKPVFMDGCHYVPTFFNEHLSHLGECSFWTLHSLYPDKYFLWPVSAWWPGNSGPGRLWALSSSLVLPAVRCGHMSLSSARSGHDNNITSDKRTHVQTRIDNDHASDTDPGDVLGRAQGSRRHHPETLQGGHLHCGWDIQRVLEWTIITLMVKGEWVASFFSSFQYSIFS